MVAIATHRRIMILDFIVPTAIQAQSDCGSESESDDETGQDWDETEL